MKIIKIINYSRLILIILTYQKFRKSGYIRKYNRNK